MIEQDVITVTCDRCGMTVEERAEKSGLMGLVGYVYEEDGELFGEESESFRFYEMSVNGEWRQVCPECAGEFFEIKRLKDEAGRIEAEFLSQLTLDNSGQLLYDMDTEQEPES